MPLSILYGELQTPRSLVRIWSEDERLAIHVVWSEYPAREPRTKCSRRVFDQARAAQIVQDAGNLILLHARRLVSHSLGHRGTHPGGPQGMGAVIPLDKPSRTSRVRIVVQMQEFGGQRAGHEKRGGHHMCA